MESIRLRSPEAREILHQLVAANPGMKNAALVDEYQFIMAQGIMAEKGLPVEKSSLTKLQACNSPLLYNYPFLPQY